MIVSIVLPSQTPVSAHAPPTATTPHPTIAALFAKESELSTLFVLSGLLELGGLLLAPWSLETLLLLSACSVPSSPCCVLSHHDHQD